MPRRANCLPAGAIIDSMSKETFLATTAQIFIRLLEMHGIDAEKFVRPVDLHVAELNDGVQVENASVVMLVLTLQFIRPLRREKLIADIFRGMRPNGCLIVVEKVLGEDSVFNRQFIKYYYDMKRRHGYSEMEISQKREALENVLIPYKLLENRELLLNSGFKAVDVFFKWYNFAGIVGRSILTLCAIASRCAASLRNSGNCATPVSIRFTLEF